MKYTDKKDKKNIRKLTLIFSLIVLSVLVTVLAISYLVMSILSYAGALSNDANGMSTYQIIVFMAIASVVMGVSISVITSKLFLSPLNMVISKIDSLASGEFGTRVDFDQIVSRVPSFLELSTVFNKLSFELQNTEMLRSDFINNFSHEFKTPIVSITGFANLLKKGNLTEEQRNQYLDAIEEESVRLSYMANNVLNLTRIENQATLSDITSFNVSEQIRSSILLLERKWDKKCLDLQLEFDEYTICANEELLKQVWINLLDNAIKFSKENGIITVRDNKSDHYVSFSITNYGIELPKDVEAKIFNKFYQADESHSTEGNGIGLAIVKRIVDLHKGNVFVKSENMSVTFTVEIPKKQVKEIV